MAKFGYQNSKEDNQFEERILHIRRVSKKTSGGNYVSFSTLVAVGDRKGSVGVGMGRGLEVPPSIKKAITQAKKKMVRIPIYNDTIPHEVRLKYKSAILLIRPAPPGTGLKLGGVVRVILDLAGVNNASGKIIGSRNQVSNAYAIIEAIKMLKPRVVYKKEDELVEKTEEKKDIKAENNKEVVKAPKKVIEKKVKPVAKKTSKIKAKKAKITK